MNRKFQRALFIFRRDLRLEDNTGLIFALKQSKEVIPCFIFTPQQIEKNDYRSDHSLQFMVESLEELESSLEDKKATLYLFHGKPEEIVEQCISHLKIDAVIVNQDYTPYSIKRDLAIESVCKNQNVSFLSFEDVLLHPPQETLKSDGKPYTVFTPFYRNASKLEVPLPASNKHDNYYTHLVDFASNRSLYDQILPKRVLPPRGGRSNALKILKKIDSFTSYESLRDFPAEDSTTHLSSHLKFNTCSIREVYWSIVKTLGDSSELIRALYWRDFFSSIAFYFPYVFSGSFHEKFDQLKWSDDIEAFKRWCDGNTGFPIVDAGMRELNQTGFMHNRVRMITASFLVKDLHINWRWGEKYFAKKLTDYDPSINNGNWQWVASTGCDAQPYFRVFNPWNQSLKFDPECLYIKKWVPELISIDPKRIHKWYLEEGISKYPSAMLDHAVESKKAIESYKKVPQKH
jgi:deoxyribodipyrimidine photo-lyase